MHHDQFWRLTATFRDGEKRAHAELCDLWRVEHFDFYAIGFAHATGLIGEIRRGADIARKIAQILGEIHALCDCLTADYGGFALGDLIAALYGER